MRGPTIASDSRRWPAWAAASVAVHIAVLAGIFLSASETKLSHAGPAVMPVELVSVSPVRAAPRHRVLPAPHTPKPAVAKTVRKTVRDVPKVPARTVAHAAARRISPVHARKRVARAETTTVRPSGSDMPASAPPPSDIGGSSAHDLDLVRRHLERFKFYPESARRRGIGGDVDVRFRLTDGGQAIHVSIASSSGYALLDRAAEDIVARAVPFPVDTGRYRVHLRFWP